MGCGMSNKTRSSIDFVVPPIFRSKNLHIIKIKIPRSARGKLRLITIREVQEEFECSTSYN